MAVVVQTLRQHRVSHWLMSRPIRYSTNEHTFNSELLTVTQQPSGGTRQTKHRINYQTN